MIRLAMLALIVAAPACARAQPIAIVAETGPAASIVIPEDAAEITACAGNPDPRFKARVAFLREGLTHALHCVETAAVMNDGDASQADRHKALLSLVAYRRGVEHLGIANMDRAAGIETDTWKEVPGFAGAWE